ncbi:MAG: hypothetical protein EOM24_30400, partial [Chloroflexia bacterium]|nr:hypothetical protein [Chloroflexia bacterium]
ASVTRACQRTAVGFEADHKCHVLAHEGNMTLPELQAWFKECNCVIALCVDGGKSSEWATKYDAVLAAVDIYNFLFFKFAAAAPEIIDVGLQFTGTLTKRSQTTLLVLHHAGVAGNYTVEQIHAAHISANGWLGIAYHYYVRRDGTIYRGRPENVIGGHTLGYNSTSIGICAEGNLDNETMPAAQQTALTALVADVLTRYPGVGIKRHSELNATSCPGANYPFAAITGTNTSATATEDPEDYDATFQTWLNSRYGSGLVVDGIYGAKTRAAAVKAYQQHVGVTADGIFGPITKEAVRTMGKGSTGTGVYILQGLLYGSGFDPQGFDGRFGDNTRAAVMAYQTRQGLAADGLAGPNTLEKLMK